ncbi:uncharacterized protein LOC134532341 [Bacillus rossius redtenbacheri]|uniref:uncharacterized protein LOC134532341 n=1 Tax=Bacillus rossius redtenbacheri TaxID=93214 RepID=UPI002FDED653
MDKKERTLTASELEKLLGMEVTKLSIKRLTAPGDNYGSVMLAVDAVLKSGRNLALVAKMFPTDEMGQKVFQSPTSMKKEIEVYQIISPEYERIQEEQLVPPSQRLHAFCDCPGARLSLEDHQAEDQLADQDSVLLLENLRVQGYRTGDRVVGASLQRTQFVLERLAKFHATAVAIKIKKPLLFRNKLLKVLAPFKIKGGTKEEDETRNKKFLESLQTIPACNRNIDALRELMTKNLEFTHSDKFIPIREPFATFAHFDFWTNNMMFKFRSETDEEPIDFKIVDFQVSQYGSPVSDIMLFLFTSTETGVVSEHIDSLLELYHRVFVDWLEVLGCETKKFSFEKFMEEVNIVAPETLMQIIYMLMPITFNKDQIETMGEGVPNDDRPVEFNDVYIVKLSEAINTYEVKKWL